MSTFGKLLGTLDFRTLPATTVDATGALSAGGFNFTAGGNWSAGAQEGAFGGGVGFRRTLGSGVGNLALTLDQLGFVFADDKFRAFTLVWQFTGGLGDADSAFGFVAGATTVPNSTNSQALTFRSTSGALVQSWSTNGGGSRIGTMEGSLSATKRLFTVAQTLSSWAQWLRWTQGDPASPPAVPSTLTETPPLQPTLHNAQFVSLGGGLFSTPGAAFYFSPESLTQDGGVDAPTLDVLQVYVLEGDAPPSAGGGDSYLQGEKRLQGMKSQFQGTAGLLV